MHEKNEKIVSPAPKGCPWKAFKDPVVRDVLDLYRDAQTGNGVHLASVKADSLNHVWQGLRHYAHACAMVKVHADAKEEAIRKARGNG